MKKYFLLITIPLLLTLRLLATNPTAHISGKIDRLNDGAQVALTIQPYTGRLDEVKTSYSIPVKNDQFDIYIPALDRPQHLQLSFKNAEKTITMEVILFPKDDLNFDYQSGVFHFNGPSGTLFSVQARLKKIAMDNNARRPYRRLLPETLASIYTQIDSAATASLQYLETKKTAIGLNAYAYLANNIMGDALFSKLERMTYASLNKPAETQESFRKAFLLYGKPFNTFPSFAVSNYDGKPSSDASAGLVYQQYLIDSCVFTHRKFSLHDCYVYESSKFSGALREQLVTTLFIVKKNDPEIQAKEIDHALTYVTNVDFRKILEKVRAKNSVGSPAPDFSLKDASDKTVSLKKFRRKVVMLDFWFTGCGACKEMAPRVRKLEEKYKNQPVVFISICVDRKREQWLSTLKTNVYTSPLSVNLYTEEKGSQHPVIQNYNVSGYPTFVLIDKNGNLAPNPNMDEDKMAELIEKYL